MTATEEHDQTKNVSAPRFVEELADEHDAWISLTDAARITRTSEPMVRRWVSTGRLPTRQEPVGINQRTRLVRLSDVGRIRPIIDPTAAITDEIHKLDLLSIPRQQAQIMLDHQRMGDLVQGMRQEIEEQINQTRLSLEEGAVALQEQIKNWEHRFSSEHDTWQQTLDFQQRQQEVLNDRVTHQRLEIEQSLNERKQQAERLQQDLEQMRAAMIDRFETILATQQGAWQEIRQQLEKLALDFSQQGRISHEMTMRLRQQEERSQNTERETKEALASTRHIQEGLRHEVTTIQQELVSHQEMFKTRGEQQWSQLMHTKAIQDERIEAIAQGLEGIDAQQQGNLKTWQVTQAHAEIQGEQLLKVIAMLQDERIARQALSDQFTLQQEQVQLLHRELECLKTQKAAAKPSNA